MILLTNLIECSTQFILASFPKIYQMRQAEIIVHAIFYIRLGVLTQPIGKKDGPDVARPI
jgi:hypothetical protein